MNVLELFLIALGLSMDAFAVSICKGLCMQKLSVKRYLTVGLYFGIFQAGMPLIGYLLGYQFNDSITRFAHWIAFVLLGIIGVNMILESRKQEDVSCEDDSAALGFRTMLVLAIATSIDALAVGVTFAFLHVKIVPAVTVIGSVTLLLSMVGVRIGHVFGIRFKGKAELLGGIILIGIGTKIIVEHLGVLGF